MGVVLDEQGKLKKVKEHILKKWEGEKKKLKTIAMRKIFKIMNNQKLLLKRKKKVIQSKEPTEELITDFKNFEGKAFPAIDVDKMAWWRKREKVCQNCST